MVKNNIKNFVYLALFAIYLIIGIYIIIVAYNGVEHDHIRIGVYVILSSIVHILLYFINRGFEKDDKSFFLVIGIVAFCMGIVFIFTKVFTVSIMCAAWGILDIVRSSLEIKDIIPQIKKNKAQLIELFISIGDIVLGVLLCIHLESELLLHLVYFGSVFILTAIKYIIHNFITHKKEEK